MEALQHPKNQNKRQDIATKILAYIDEKKYAMAVKTLKQLYKLSNNEQVDIEDVLD